MNGAAFALSLLFLTPYGCWPKLEETSADRTVSCRELDHWEIAPSPDGQAHGLQGIAIGGWPLIRCRRTVARSRYGRPPGQMFSSEGVFFAAWTLPDAQNVEIWSPSRVQAYQDSIVFASDVARNRIYKLSIEEVYKP